MKNYLSVSKMSKKDRKAYFAAQRSDWGTVRPFTRVKPSGKAYNRKTAKQDLRRGRA